MSLATKLFGTYSERQLKKLDKFVDYIESLESKYSSMSNEELADVTNVLRDRLAHGETLEDILADAFAAIREADYRVLGKKPFRVQLIGGIVLLCIRFGKKLGNKKKAGKTEKTDRHLLKYRRLI